MTPATTDQPMLLTRRFKRRRPLLIVPLVIALVMILVSMNVNAAPKDKQAPSAPTGLAAVSVAETAVSLAWTASKDNSGKIASYRVYRGTTLAGTSAAASYTASGLAAGTSYSFTVRAVDPAGNVSASSSPLSVKTAQPQAAEPVPAPVPTEPVPAAPAPSAGKAAIGYYTGWSTYNGKQIAELDGGKLTHISYAFANIGPDLRIALGDAYADTEKLFPGDTGAEPFKGNFNQLLKLKQRYPHLKTLIAVGGWSWSERFSDVALTDASRTAFADSAAAFVAKYGFDGVDIDWEYPVGGGESDNVNRPEDKTNFTLLMQKLREKLDAQGAKDGKTYVLSFAGAANASYAKNVELDKLSAIADYVNVMSYDIHGPWDAKTGLNAPLLKDPNSGFAWESSVADALTLYRNAGVPAGKLVMGVPFYGYRYDGVANANDGLYQSFAAAKALSYAEIANVLSGGTYTRHYHDASKVPYLFNGSTFITYDDAASIAAKGAYVREQGLAGAMIWSLGMDKGSDLLTALHDSLQ